MNVNSKKEPALHAGLFHAVNSIIPADQEVITVSPEETVEDAIRLLAENNFSQLPVVSGDQVLGLFSYKTYTLAVVRLSGGPRDIDPLTLKVEECMALKPHFATLDDGFEECIDVLDSRDAALVGRRNHLSAILTPMDILRYLNDVASPFVLIGEFERALRSLMDTHITAETLIVCANRTLRSKYGDNIPSDLDEMEFGDYISIITHGDNWQHFEPLLGGDRIRTRAMLIKQCDIRNVIFHFKREITLDEHQTLARNRNQMEARCRRVNKAVENER